VAQSHKVRSARRVAALADVHGNAPALEAVLAEVELAGADLVVFCGDLTWGPLPRETLALVRALAIPAKFVRGNGDRAVGTDLESDRARWMASMHGEEDTAFLAGFEATVSVDVEGLGPTCFCHGSPRSDEECVTERTPPERVREFMAGVEEKVVVTAHTHMQYDRVVDGVRLLSPGSVGLPYEPERGAFWALLGPDVELRRTDYDLEATVARIRQTVDPKRETIAEMMLEPPSREDVIEDAERLVFAG
jgi:predicted phosphodiesterase